MNSENPQRETLIASYDIEAFSLEIPKPIEDSFASIVGSFSQMQQDQMVQAQTLFSLDGNMASFDKLYVSSRLI